MNHSGCNRDLELIKDFLVQRVNEEKVGHLIDVLDRVMDQINEEGKEQMDLEHHEEDKAYWRYNE